MKEIKISTIGALDMLKFKNLSKKRKSFASSGSSKPLPEEYKANLLARTLHPKKQMLKVKEIIPLSKNIKTIVLEPSIEGEKLAPFKAGQYVNITCHINDSIVSRPYALSSSPKMAREGEYRITVKAISKGVVSKYLSNDLKVGEILEVSEPSGTFYYNSIRDQKRIIGIAGGIGVTPFYSLALAILDGDEDVEMTLFYGAKKEKDLVFKDKFDDIVCKTNKVKVIYVLSEEKNENYEYGFIGIKMIKKELYDSVSFFMAGPSAMIERLNKDLKNLKLPRRYFRYEDISCKKNEDKYSVFSLLVIDKKNKTVIPCQSNETLLTALERAGIKTQNKCHVGSCGFCRSKLLSGSVLIPRDKRREADKTLNYIHPCCSYPLSDCKIELN